MKSLGKYVHGRWMMTKGKFNGFSESAKSLCAETRGPEECDGWRKRKKEYNCRFALKLYKQSASTILDLAQSTQTRTQETTRALLRLWLWILFDYDLWIWLRWTSLRTEMFFDRTDLSKSIDRHEWNVVMSCPVPPDFLQQFLFNEGRFLQITADNG